MSDKQRVSNFVDGERRDPADGRTSDLVDPVTGEVYASAPLSSEADVDHAYGAAARAFETWRDTTPAERQHALLKLADALESRAAEFVDGGEPGHGQARRAHRRGGDPARGRPAPLLRRRRSRPRGPRGG